MTGQESPLLGAHRLGLVGDIDIAGSKGRRRPLERAVDGRHRGLEKLRMLALTTFEEDDVLWGAIEAGAAGFVLKDAPAADLVGAVRVIARGGSWLDPRVADRVLGTLRRQQSVTNSAPSVDALTEREVEVLRHVASGANNQEIAESLYLSERTVKGHVSAIFLKLGVRDRAAAIIRAYDAGIVVPRSSPHE